MQQKIQLASQSQRRFWPYAAIFLLFIFWFSRLHNLLSFPLFLDEASHLTRAQNVWLGKPFYLLETGKALAPYFAALFWPFSAAPFIGRYVVVLLDAIGIASAYAVGRELHSRQAGLLTMTLWIVCPQLMFFERMALVDTTMGSMAMFTLWIAIRMIRAGKMRYAVGCGIGLTLIMAAKLTGLTLLPLPVLTIVLVCSRLPWRIRIRQVVIAYVVAAIVLIGPFLYVRSAGEDPTGESSGLTSVSLSSLPQRIKDNVAQSWQAEIVYQSGPMFLLMLSMSIVAIAYRPRAGLLLLAVIALPLGAIMATAVSLWLRYLSPMTPFLLLLTAIGMLIVVEGLRLYKQVPKRAIGVLPWLAVAVWAILVGIPFQLTAYNNPSQVNLPYSDREEYVNWIPSGFGIREAAKYVVSQAKLSNPMTIIGVVGNCDSFRLYLPLNAPVNLSCPGLDWGGENYNVITAIRIQAAQLGHVYVLGEDALVPEDQLPAQLVTEQQFVRPSGKWTVKLYRINASDSSESDSLPSS